MIAASHKRLAPGTHVPRHMLIHPSRACGGFIRMTRPLEAATKLLFLVLNRTEKEWIMPPREWCMAKAQFAVLFGERFTRAMA
jgi:hypothetical protein